MWDLIELKSNSVRIALNILLKDRSTGKNITFASNTYNGMDFASEITKKLIDGDKVIFRPRVAKSQKEQVKRTRKKAEVFTPSWICNMMNNQCDQEWFGRDDVFNSEQNKQWETVEKRIVFPVGKTWKDYVLARRLEITCGEGPYLVSRYDTVTGEMIPLSQRIGILDRKLRVINENVKAHRTWNQWVYRAFESTYGYEYQGDNLLMARINLLETFCEYSRARWESEPSQESIKRIARIISWNIWQMDGLLGTLPRQKPQEIEEKEIGQLQLFTPEEVFESTLTAPAYSCQVRDWQREKGKQKIVWKRDKDMKFDFVIGNPPYQEDTKGAGRQAKPVYNLFFQEAKKITTESISLITPSRWFSGGMGLNQFRDEMMNDKSLKVICDYTNAKDCFPDNSVSGGVNYFIWKKNHHGDCLFINTTNGIKTQLKRNLNEFPVLVRYNQAINIIHKVQKKSKSCITDITSGLMPFGLSTSYRGKAKKSRKYNLSLYASDCVTYISESEIDKGFEYVDKYKVLISKTGAEHAGEPSKDGKFRVIPSSMKVIGPNEVCTHSYFLIGSAKDRNIAEHICKYMKTKFVRFLMLMAMSGFGLSKNVLIFVPNQDFCEDSDVDWSDEISEINSYLYQKYELTQDNIEFIENNVKEME